MSVTATLTLFPSAIQNLLAGPTGPVSIYIVAQGNLVANKARSIAPRRTGHLANSIVTEVTYGFDGAESFVKAQTEYALSVHQGARPHPIDAVNVQVLSFPSSGMQVFTPHVDHPGQKAQPFLVDAMVSVISL